MSERNTLIVDLAQRGINYEGIARMCGISKARVGQIVVGAVGVKDPGRRLRQDERVAIVDAARRGMCVRHISGVVGRNANTIVKVLDEAGITAVNNRDVFGPDARALAVDLVRGGSSYHEAANACDMTKNAVIGACYRARKKASR